MLTERYHYHLKCRTGFNTTPFVRVAEHTTAFNSDRTTISFSTYENVRRPYPSFVKKSWWRLRNWTEDVGFMRPRKVYVRNWQQKIYVITTRNRCVDRVGDKNVWFHILSNNELWVSLSYKSFWKWLDVDWKWQGNDLTIYMLRVLRKSAPKRY